ncbi:MAG: hypothetical protein JWP25_1485 [Bradyrhizobium sp.]|jgi:hypothetical protein|nr:hypothetical protein [Bradyrhizobium sp.]
MTDTKIHPRIQFEGRNMKRSRRVVLTMMGTAAIGAVSTGFVRRSDCGPGSTSQLIRDQDGRLIESCRVSYGGFGGAPHRFHGHSSGHGHAHGGG